MLSDKEEDKMSIVSKVKTQSGIKGERRKEKSKNKTRHLMRIGYLRTRHCSCANTQFSIRKNTGQYTGFPIAAH